MTTATCHYGVTRKGQYQPCDVPAVGERMGEGGAYPVCKRHFNKAQQPPLPWRLVSVARVDPATRQPLEPRVVLVRPCHDHAAYIDGGALVLSCSRCRIQAAVVCPECRDGKCRNCIGEAMTDDDEMVPCGCPNHAHAAQIGD
ncbi:hypothetical protein B0I12_002538 [Microbacterium hydrothermale]|uniref:hypothetical protein n=1 Tax=Microbacterium hydrothermale TaxID=857427 RepID=UPI002227185E|nr:hypothetical protein [Microbacterium hydrothermale]MCW2165383.1 hypothetical protein [Microbacterium hydrothermale]